ncbi:MAG: PQQ-like beta-propeller repeat protein [Planctomycetaceae bacterium]|nr:PQQ-like beta-propeller repeat protein [Planctomycetaceae bacterium]
MHRRPCSDSEAATRRILRAVAALFFVACGSVFDATRAEDWPAWRGPRGDGTWHAPAIPRKWPEEGLTSLWKKPIGGGYSGVSVAGERVVVTDRRKEPAEVERILCLKADTGETLWSVEYPVEYGKLDYGTGPRAAPTIHDGRVYTVGAVGDVHCLNLATGQTLWSTHLLRNRFGRLQEWGYSGSPFIYEDLVILQPGAQYAGSILALNRHTGATVWSALSDAAGYATPILISVEGIQQLICWTPSHIRALDPRRGIPLWSVPYPVTYGVSIATPVFHQKTVLVCGYWEGSNAIRPAANGAASLLWEENRHLRGLMSQPLCRDGHAYLLDKQYGLTCFEVATGKKLWDDGNTLTPRDRNPHASIVALQGTNDVLALNAKGELVLATLTPQNYQEHARAKILGDTWAHPAFTGRRVYARNDTEIVCVELPVEDPPNP